MLTLNRRELQALHIAWFKLHVLSIAKQLVTGEAANKHQHHRVPYHIGPLDDVLQLRVTELQADDVVELFTLGLWRFVVSHKLGHAHFNAPLRVHIHHVHYPSASCKRTETLSEHLPLLYIYIYVYTSQQLQGNCY